ncbi:MAG: NAD(P)(+) transhydrogenase (Re/Si-specific) subunit beta [Desulfobacter sp.]|nr:NAD(P)(+) transhydrogenase (Re/Si-specific) subunit beta [Desulfobacter sp.]
MPVLISFLNATTGLAAALCGMVLCNKLLISCGAAVAASGSVLTHVMCQAMNRSLYRVFVPLAKTRDLDPDKTNKSQPDPETTQPSPEKPNPIKDMAEKILNAKKTVIVPGYGMAVAQAQFEQGSRM